MGDWLTQSRAERSADWPPSRPTGRQAAHVPTTAQNTRTTPKPNQVSRRTVTHLSYRSEARWLLNSAPKINSSAQGPKLWPKFLTRLSRQQCILMIPHVSGRCTMPLTVHAGVGLCGIRLLFFQLFLCSRTQRRRPRASHQTSGAHCPCTAGRQCAHPCRSGAALPSGVTAPDPIRSEQRTANTGNDDDAQRSGPPVADRRRLPQ